jgi:hypothetical protein
METMGALVVHARVLAVCLAVAATSACGGGGPTEEDLDGAAVPGDATTPARDGSGDDGALDATVIRVDGRASPFDATAPRLDTGPDADKPETSANRLDATLPIEDGASDAAGVPDAAEADADAEADGRASAEAGDDGSIPADAAAPETGVVADDGADEASAAPDAGSSVDTADACAGASCVGPTCEQSDGAIYTCPAGDDCCASPVPPYPTRCAPAGACPGGSYPIDCAGATDLPDAGVTGQCSGGQVCCGQATLTGIGTPPNCGVAELTSACTEASACPDDAPTSCAVTGNPYIVRLCTSPLDCESANNGDTHCCKCTSSPLYICAGTLGPLLCTCMN